MSTRLRLGVLISGRGSNLQALIDACAHTDFPAEIAVVISNVPDVMGLERTKQAGLPSKVINHKGFANRETFEAAIQETLTEAKVDLVCLAGFMRILTSDFVKKWHNQMINIHPSLLPAYKGLDTHKRAMMDGARFTGCTVHFVRPDMDTGPIIAQAAVPIAQTDTIETLSAKVLVNEHLIFPQAIRWIAEDKLHIDGNTVNIDGTTSPEAAVINPPAK